LVDPFAFAIPVASAGVGVLLGWLLANRLQRRRQPALPREAGLLQAVQHLARGSLDEALHGLQELAERAPDDLTLALAYGTLLRRKGDVLRAIRLHSRLLASPSLEPALRGFVLTELGADFTDAGLLERAERALGEARALLGPHPWYCEMALPLLIRMGQFEKGEQLLGELESQYHQPMAQRRALILQEQALRLLERGQIEAAGTKLLEARSVDGHCLSALVLLARCKRLCGQPETAQALLAEHHHQLVDQAWFYFQEWDRCCQQLGMDETMRSHLKRWLGDHPEDWRSILVLGGNFQRCGYMDEAFGLFMNCFELSPNSLRIHQAIWRFLLAHPDPVPFLKTYSGAVRKEWIFLPPYECGECGYHAEDLFWYCPACNHLETCQERKV
jgi:lipopolysaccharide biosynthesis regulator YciM